MPKLLVSVQTPEEARIAIEAGVDLIDVKDISRGSLGFLGGERLVEIHREVRALTDEIPISAAMGELADGLKEPLPEQLSPLAYLKMGLSGMRAETGWVERWTQARKNLCSQFQTRSPEWIAVIYVDEIRACAPVAEEIVAAAAETQCAGVLFDTFDKSGGGLFAHLAISRLECLAKACEQAGLMKVFAGKVGRRDIPVLKRLGADVIAVRSAACRNGERAGGIDREAVRGLVRDLECS